MSSSLSHEQLAMFMTPKEIKARGVDPHEFTHEDVNEEDPHDSSPQEHFLWARKADEAHSWPDPEKTYKRAVPKNLHEDIKQHGVKEAVHLDEKTGQLQDGYHRVAVADELRPNELIPVKHGIYDENWN